MIKLKIFKNEKRTVRSKFMNIITYYNIRYLKINP